MPEFMVGTAHGDKRYHAVEHGAKRVGESAVAMCALGVYPSPTNNFLLDDEHNCTACDRKVRERLEETMTAPVADHLVIDLGVTCQVTYTNLRYAEVGGSIYYRMESPDGRTGIQGSIAPGDPLYAHVEAALRKAQGSTWDGINADLRTLFDSERERIAWWSERGFDGNTRMEHWEMGGERALGLREEVDRMIEAKETQEFSDRHGVDL